MTEDLKQKIAKIYELVNRGATEGERAAARKALDRVMKKYNLSDDVLQDVGLKRYKFSYATDLEIRLFCRIWAILLDKADTVGQSSGGKKYLAVTATYEDYVLLDCAYAYFRKHMKAQYNKTVMPEVKRCRTTKTRNAKRKELSNAFFSRYIIRSNLYKESELTNSAFKSKKEWELHGKMMGIEGGEFNKQVAGNNLLTY